MKKIDIDTIISSPQIEELGKKTIATLPKDFSDNQIIAIAKAVLYIISADGVVTEEEKQFFTQLCADLKALSQICDLTTYFLPFLRTFSLKPRNSEYCLFRFTTLDFSGLISSPSLSFSHFSVAL